MVLDCQIVVLFRMGISCHGARLSDCCTYCSEWGYLVMVLDRQIVVLFRMGISYHGTKQW